MRPAHVIEIVTPKKVILNGLWFGPKKAQNMIIFIHGLTGSLFSMRRMVETMQNSSTAVIVFNNRGFEQVGEVTHRRGFKSEYIRAGAAHEAFTDCVDDIQGAVNFAQNAGAKGIYLAGHSTGCQKIIYYASRNPVRTRRVLNGLILFGPLSDYAIALEQDRDGKLARSVAYARKLVRAGKSHELMPTPLGPWFVCDAQRFLSLYTPDSSEEIFTYAQPEKPPSVLRAVKVPILVLLAGADEHSKLPARKIADWFAEHLKIGDEIVVLPRVKHSFKGAEKRVAALIREFMSA
jgi:pimeloyl-ACP methyl ester carboxylesterase